MDTEPPRDPEHAKPQAGPGLIAAFGSACAAAFGVQSRRNRERDFTAGRARTFVIVGITFTLGLILAIYLVVHLVLHRAAA
ncbi:MAG: DUF2970 domain-containing protein [Panacagrimonas sp.]